MVVLAVDVARDAASDRDELGAGSDRRKPALRQEHAQDLAKAQPSLTRETTRRRIERQNAIGARGLDHQSLGC